MFPTSDRYTICTTSACYSGKIEEDTIVKTNVVTAQLWSLIEAPMRQCMRLMDMHQKADRRTMTDEWEDAVFK